MMRKASAESTGLPITVPSSSCALVSAEMTRSGITWLGTDNAWGSKDEAFPRDNVLRKATILALASSSTKSGPDASLSKFNL